MKPFWEARVDDLGPGDFVKVECQCGHVELLTMAMLRTAGLPDYGPIRKISSRLSRRECDANGKVDVSIVWAG